MITAQQDRVEKYRRLSRRLADPRALAELKSLFKEQLALRELLEWLHSKVKWDNGNIKRHNDPKEILVYGRGRCGEFSILFTALCLAHGYRARLILDMSDHVWTEVWNTKEGRWIHVDPSEKKIDDPKMYERDWKKDLKEIYAFENGNVENVTLRYKLNLEQRS
jgi:transglutaminase-like putative cysteine protease